MSTQNQGKNNQRQYQYDDENEPFNRIKIMDLPFEVTKAHLEELCSKFGRIRSIEMRKGNYGMIGLVTFMKEVDAEFALYRLVDYVYMNRKIKVYPAPVTQEEVERKRREQSERDRRNEEFGQKKKKSE